MKSTTITFAVSSLYHRFSHTISLGSRSKEWMSQSSDEKQKDLHRIGNILHKTRCSHLNTTSQIARFFEEHWSYSSDATSRLSFIWFLLITNTFRILLFHSVGYVEVSIKVYTFHSLTSLPFPFLRMSVSLHS